MKIDNAMALAFLVLAAVLVVHLLHAEPAAYAVTGLLLALAPLLSRDSDDPKAPD